MTVLVVLHVLRVLNEVDELVGEIGANEVDNVGASVCSCGAGGAGAGAWDESLVSVAIDSIAHLSCS